MINEHSYGCWNSPWIQSSLRVSIWLSSRWINRIAGKLENAWEWIDFMLKVYFKYFYIWTFYKRKQALKRHKSPYKIYIALTYFHACKDIRASSSLWRHRHLWFELNWHQEQEFEDHEVHWTEKGNWQSNVDLIRNRCKCTYSIAFYFS